MKLALGTVQFGLTYGIANAHGRVTAAEAAGIVGDARAAGIDTLDTASLYGDSETRLGEIGVDRWRIVTKLGPVPEGDDAARWTADSVRASLQRLRVPRLFGLLLHRPGQLLAPGGDHLHAALQDAKHRGLVEKIGASIYEPAELDALERYPLDLIQAPFSVLDRRLLTTGWLDRLAERGVELHVRSIFLQGLLVMPPERRPEDFRRWAPLWSAYDAWVAASGLSAVEACVRDALSFPQIARVVVGVDSRAHLAAILAAARGAPLTAPAFLGTDAVDLLNPSRWRVHA